MTRWSWPKKLTLRLSKSEALNASRCFCLLPAPSTLALMCALMESRAPLLFLFLRCTRGHLGLKQAYLRDTGMYTCARRVIRA